MKYTPSQTDQRDPESRLFQNEKGEWEGGDHFDLGESGNLYSELGMSNADIGMRSGVIKKATDKKGKQGNLSVLRNDFYKDLKEWVMHPAAIIDEPERNSVAVITGEINEYGFPIVAYIEKNTKIDYWPAHELKSVYGLQNIGELIKSAQENGAKIKICDNKKLQGLSLENVLTMNASFTNLATDDSISNADAGVNTKNRASRKSMEAIDRILDKKIFSSLRLCNTIGLVSLLQCSKNLLM